MDRGEDPGSPGRTQVMTSKRDRRRACAARVKRMYNRRKAMGVCVRCAAPARPGSAKCESCHTKQRYAYLKHKLLYGKRLTRGCQDIPAWNWAEHEVRILAHQQRVQQELAQLEGQGRKS